MSRPSFDLLIEPWIPVRWIESATHPVRPARVGLREFFQYAHEIAAIPLSIPPALSALYRVLYALTIRITGLSAVDDWSDRRFSLLDTGRFSARDVAAYFDATADRFDLYHPEWPFLQDPRLAAECKESAGVNTLVVTRPSGNNHSWFVHTLDDRPPTLSSAQAVLHMLVWHYYGRAGKCSTRTVNGQAHHQLVAAPLRGTLSYHPLGDTLFQTLLAGIPEPRAAARPHDDLCAWEHRRLPAPMAPPQVPSGPCSSLTGRSQHALLLVPDASGKQVRDAYITWAYRDKLEARDDDYLIWQITKDGRRFARPAKADRALWRDLDALLLNDPPGSARPARPAIFRTAAEIGQELHGRMRVHALGVEQTDKEILFVSATTPPVFGLMQETDITRARQVGQLRGWGESAGIRLRAATRRAWEILRDPPPDRRRNEYPWSIDAVARYWPAAETEFWHRLNTRDLDGAKQAFRRLAVRAYDEVTATASRTAPGARAVEEARVQLYRD